MAPHKNLLVTLLYSNYKHYGRGTDSISKKPHNFCNYWTEKVEKSGFFLLFEEIAKMSSKHARDWSTKLRGPFQGLYNDVICTKCNIA